MAVRAVSHAIAPSSDHPSKCLPSGSPSSGKKWSQVQIESAPSASARRHASRSSSIEQCCGSSWTPTLMRAITLPSWLAACLSAAGCPAAPSALQQHHAVQRHVLELDAVHLPDVPADAEPHPDLTGRAEGPGHAEGPGEPYVHGEPGQHLHLVR